jgi:hypothetical protein
MYIKLRDNIYNFKEYGLTILTIDDIFNNVQVELLNILPLTTTTKYYYIPINQDFKRLFLHFFIEAICDEMAKISNSNKILYIQSSFIDNNYEIWEYVDKEEIFQLVMKNTKKIQNKLPFPVVISDSNVDLSNMTGESVDLIHNLISKIDKHKFKPVTFRKLREVSIKNGLNSLTDKYYQSSKFRKLIYS